MAYQVLTIADWIDEVKRAGLATQRFTWVVGSGFSVSAARTQYIPSLSFSSGYNWQNQTASFSGGNTSWNMSLRMSYPIFNGFQRETAIDRAQYVQRVAQLQEDDARLGARGENYVIGIEVG